METSHEFCTVSLERQIIFWGLALAVMCYGLHLLGSAVTPFAAGIALGYLLDPVVSKMETLGFNRLGASLLILVVFAATFAISLIIVGPILGNQFVAFAQHLPGYAVKLQALAVDEGNAPDRKVWRRLADRAGDWRTDFEQSNSKVGRGFCRPRRTVADRRVEVARFGRGCAFWLLVATHHYASCGVLYPYRLA